jgi:hypothetical protein
MPTPNKLSAICMNCAMLTGWTQTLPKVAVFLKLNLLYRRKEIKSKSREIDLIDDG